MLIFALISFTPAASHQTSSVDQTNNTYSQQFHESQHGPSSSKGPSSTESSEEDK